MKKLFSTAAYVMTLGAAIFFFNTETFSQQNINTWKAGLGKIEITPDKSMWMAGYAARDHPSEGVRHAIWAKALALEDLSGKQAVVVTIDLVGLRQELSGKVRKRLMDEFGLAKDQVILNSSHTHTGPETDFARYQFQINSNELNKIRQYAEKIEDQLVALVGKTLKSLEPVKLYAGNGGTRFQVNRRNNKEASINYQTELNGPNDYAVPVIKVEDQKGEIKAILFGYACHPTVLSDYQISGDYAGFAQIALEKLYPGTTALFFQGAGADQNPLPRRSVPLAKQYGKELSGAVERVLNEDMKVLEANIATAYSEIDLTYAKSVPTMRELKDIISGVTTGYPQYLIENAKVLLSKLEKGEALNPSYPYPIQAWKLGDQPIFTFGGELLVGYSIELKKIFGPDIFVMGYSNDVMGYIPTKKVLAEGGYEANRSPIFTTQWAASIEDHIISETVNLAESIGIEPVEYPLIAP